MPETYMYSQNKTSFITKKKTKKTIMGNCNEFNDIRQMRYSCSDQSDSR